MSLISNIDKVAYTSSIPIDKIIKTYTGTITAGAGVSGSANGTLTQIDTAANSTVVTHSWFSQMIWSDNGGTNWYPGGNPHNTLSSYNNNGMELTVVSTVNGGDVYVYAINQRPSTVSIMYKVAVFDRSVDTP